MFNLPTFTAFVLFGFPTLWVLYTVVFLISTRGWAKAEQNGEGQDL